MFVRVIIIVNCLLESITCMHYGILHTNYVQCYVCKIEFSILKSIQIAFVHSDIVKDSVIWLRFVTNNELHFA